MDSSLVLYLAGGERQQDHEYRHRFEPTAVLLEEEEHRRWQAAEIMSDLERDLNSWKFPRESMEFVLTSLQDVQVELQRRERLSHQRIAPQWPERDGQRYQELRNVAIRLKTVVTLELFCQHELGLTLRKVRDGFLTTCPFKDHPDLTPSFSISSTKQLFHCFGCGRGGDVFTLCGQLYGLDHFREQVLMIARVAGLTEGEAEHVG